MKTKNQKKFLLFIRLYFVVTFIVIIILVDILLGRTIGAKQGYEEPVVQEPISAWEGIENYSNVYNFPGYGEVHYSTQKYGFRVFGDTNTNKLKILVIGDSFTGSVEISDGKLYYNYFTKWNPHIELFAYGVSGYGTLQEYMILDRYLDLIKPDIILWQFCANDIINNSHTLESASFLHNNHLTRPYYNIDKDEIEWLEPNQNYGVVYNYFQKSFLFKNLKIGELMDAFYEMNSIETRIDKKDPLFVESINVTKAIMAKVKQKAKNIPVIAFAVILDDFPVVNEQTFADITKPQDIYFIYNIQQGLTDAKERGLRIDGSDTGGDEHWNETGHYIAGEIIYQYLLVNDFMQKQE